MKPYIGITDFETYEQVKQTLNIFTELSAGKNPRDLMVGVMMSYKTLKGMETKWTKAWPPKEKVGEIFIHSYPALPVLNTLHYADYDGLTTKNDLCDALLFADSKNGLDAVQLDMPWPDKDMVVEAIEMFHHKQFRKLRTVLQVGKVAIAACDNDRDKVINKIGSYHGAFDWVLLDLSGGKGIPLDANLLLGYLSEMKNRYPYISLAVAGGLGPDTMHLIKPIIEQFPDISIDAQGKLRPSGSALDPIDWSLAEKYLRESFALFP